MSQNPQRSKISIQKPVLSKNDMIATQNRQLFDKLGIFAMNIISSPGSGKTSLLEALAGILKEHLVVIEGDVQTRRDAERIEKTGCRAYQIETNGGCHLDAESVAHALKDLKLEQNPCKIVAIENVGNLVCPSSFDLGEHMKVALLSLPEGDDKILKYPSIFRRIGVLLITKMDLVPHMDFDVDRVVQECASLNENFETFKVSSKTGEYINEFCDFLMKQCSALNTDRRS